MAAFKQGDVIRVPFPYTDRNTRQYRPALIVSSHSIGTSDALLWVVMITSADNRSWPGDCSIKRFQSAGLPAASVIRTAKIATIEARHAERIGAVDMATLAAAMRRIRKTLSKAETAN